MRHFKIGQTVYYYCESDGLGEIISAKISAAVKDLATNEIIYTVRDASIAWFNNRNLTSDYLYASKEKILKEHRDEVVYGRMHKKLLDLENLLHKVMTEYADKIEANPSFITISATDCGVKSLIVDGIGNLHEEFDKLKNEVEAIKKKIKKPTKKTVKKEKPTDEKNKKTN